ncbi:MAG: hypothetical protein ACRDQW_07635 [Haloechinothrix sp.]
MSTRWRGAGAWTHLSDQEAYEHVDMISAHTYYHQQGDDIGSFLASSVDMDHFIESVVAAADYVRAARELSRRINISFDERVVSVPPRVEAADGRLADHPEV